MAREKGSRNGPASSSSSATTGPASHWISRTHWTRLAVDRSRHSAPSRDVTRGSEMKVSVFGLGYVGSVSAASFAADGHTVVGVDVNPDKVTSLSEGRSPIVEKGLDELIRDNAANGRLRATTSTADAVEATDLSLI